MDRLNVLREVEQLTAEQEEAIQHHPHATVAIYQQGRDAFIEGQRNLQESDWSRSTGLSLQELSVLHHYMLTSSFISAWYHLHGDAGRRDKAAQSCSMLVSSTGIDDEIVRRRYSDYERVWCQALQAEGITPARPQPLMLVVVLVVLIGIMVVLF